MFLKKLVGYLDITKLFRKSGEENLNLRFMHGINRISVFVFLICIIVLIIRYATKS